MNNKYNLFCQPIENPTSPPLLLCTITISDNIIKDWPWLVDELINELPKRLKGVDYKNFNLIPDTIK